MLKIYCLETYIIAVDWFRLVTLRVCHSMGRCNISPQTHMQPNCHVACSLCHESSCRQRLVGH